MKKNTKNFFQDLLQKVNLNDPATSSRLGVFVSILIARHCFKLQSFVMVGVQSLLKTWDDIKAGVCTKAAELGARLR